MDEQGEGDGAGPGAIAAELGNGDPNGRRCGEESPGSKRSSSSSSDGASRQIWQLRRSRSWEHARYLADTGANFLSRPVNELKHSHGNKHHHSQGVGCGA